MVSDNKKMWRFVGNANSLLSLYDHTTGVPPVPVLKFKIKELFPVHQFARQTV